MPYQSSHALRIRLTSNGQRYIRTYGDVRATERTRCVPGSSPRPVSPRPVNKVRYGRV